MQFFNILSLDIESLLLFGVQLEQFLSGSHRLNRVLDFTGEFPNIGKIFFSDFLFTLAPVGGTHVLYHGFVSVLDHFVQLDQTLRRYFSEDDFIVICLQQIHLFNFLMYFVFDVVFGNGEVFDKVDRFFF